MACLILTRVVINQLFPAENIKVRHFGNHLHGVHLRLSNACNFFLSVDENIKCGYSFSKLDRNEHFGTKCIVFF